MSRRKQTSPQGRDRTLILLCLGVLLVLAAILFSQTAGESSARYVTQTENDGLAIAGNFYFTSDLLDGSTHTLASDTTSITFTLGNHGDKLRCSEVEIAYEVTVASEDTDCALSERTGTFLADQIQDTSITLSGLTPGKSYTVTAVGQGGYHQTLTGTFYVQPVDSAVYYDLDTSDSSYVLLTVWTENYTGSITITYPDPLIPDNTDPVLEQVKTGETITDQVSFSAEGYTSHVYRFFGSGVTVQAFTITCEQGVIAQEKALG